MLPWAFAKSKVVERRVGGGAGADLPEGFDGDWLRDAAKAEATIAFARELTVIELWDVAVELREGIRGRWLC